MLVAEDNDTAGRVLADLIRRAGMEVLVTPNAELTLAELRSDRRIDAVVIDNHLADFGATLAREIHELPNRPKLALIQLASPGRRGGTPGLFVSVVSKPVKAAQLYDALLGVIARK